MFKRKCSIPYIMSDINPLPHNPDLTTLGKKPLENIVGKGEKAGNQHFLLFPQCFLPFPKQNVIFGFMFNLSSTKAFNLNQSEILLCGKELTLSQTSPGFYVSAVQVF